MNLLYVFCFIISSILGFIIKDRTNSILYGILAWLISMAILYILQTCSKLYKLFCILFGMGMGTCISCFILTLIVDTKFEYTNIHKMEELPIILICGAFFFFITYFYAWANTVLYAQYGYNNVFLSERKARKTLKHMNKEQKKAEKAEQNAKAFEEQSKKEAENRVNAVKSSNGTGGYFNI